MRTRNVLIAAGLLWVPAAWGCGAGKPPQELRDARAAYERAQSGPAAQYSPADLHVAQVALQQAESFYRDNKDDQATRDLSYIAARKAQLAEERGTMVMADAQKAQIQRSSQLQAREQLNQAKDELEALQQRLMQEKMARDAAEAKAQQALQSLSSMYSVKEDDRGTVITLSGSVLFPTNSTKLLPSARNRLDQVATALAQQGDKSIVVQGFTDSRGNDNQNQKLSQQRAEAVRDYLVSKGVSGDRVRAEGKGESNPVADNTTAEGRANNRRVEIVVQPSGGSQTGSESRSSGGGMDKSTGKGFPGAPGDNSQPQKQPQK